MNIYESSIPLPDCDTRISIAARLRYNSQVHGAAGIPLGPVSIAGIIEETVADEMPFTDGDTLELLSSLIDPGTCENLNSPLGKVRIPDENYEGGWRVEPIENCPYCGRRVVAPKRTLLKEIPGGYDAAQD